MDNYTINSPSFNQTYPIQLSPTMSVVHLICASVGIPMNLLVASVIIAFRRLHKPRNILWLGVTFCNLLPLISGLLDYIYVATENHVVCLVFVSVLGITYPLLLFSLLLALIDCYLAITHSLWHKTHVTIRRVIFVQMAGLIILPLMIKMPMLLGLVPFECNRHQLQLKTAAAANMLFLISCIVLQIKIYQKIRQHVAVPGTGYCSRRVTNNHEISLNVLRAHPPTQSTEDPEDAAGAHQIDAGGIDSESRDNGCAHVDQRLISKIELEATKALLTGVTSLCFFTCPLCLVVFVIAICPDCAPSMGNFVLYARLMFLFHAIYNPVNYVVRSREFCTTLLDRFNIRRRRYIG